MCAKKSNFSGTHYSILQMLIALSLSCFVLYSIQFILPGSIMILLATFLVILADGKANKRSDENKEHNLNATDWNSDLEEDAVEKVKRTRPPKGGWTTLSYSKLFPAISKTMSCERCPPVYFPVCSDQNLTFMNICFFNCNNFTDAKIVQRGICIFY